ncbi:iron ABC transporter ATP-binding protein [Streptomyces otsuchiensis]|uniref:iron ABC transporter ATP-binding protein n=1 Tax=Streptomyces otsuchiensis TaxID=2681388 RepID=UPI00102FA33A|nr:ATP-binding cassette domain-containing protein [Streptomyces otsuchiensis]
MIEFSDLHKEYQGQSVLGPVTGAIEKGGITSIVGPNGAGKSTLLTMMGRLLDPTGGTVTIEGRDVFTTKSRDLARNLSILRQENQFTARLRVRELVAFGRFPHSQGRLTEEDLEHVRASMEFLNLTALADRYLDQLSGGQRQRAYVAMVLAQDTEYVLLDEPLNNLDMKHSVLMMRQLRRAADQLGKTIVIIIHDINFAAAHSDRIMALRDGQVVTTGTIGEIMRDTVLTEVFDTPVKVIEVDAKPIAIYYS